MQKSIYSKEYSLILKLLRETREEKGISQVEVATRLNSTQSLISKVERGERRIDIVELREYCRALDTDFLEFAKLLDHYLTALEKPTP